METKTLSTITTVSMVLTISVAALSIIGATITGLYPGIAVFLVVALVPIASKFSAKKINNKSGDFKRDYFTTLAIINLLVIIVVLWMTFVILIDRVFPVIL